MKAPGFIQRCLGMDPLKGPGPRRANVCSRARVKLCSANLSTKSHFGSFAKPQKHFLEEKRSLHHLEAQKRACFEGDLRIPKKLAVRGNPLLAAPEGVERRAACRSASAVVLLGLTLAGPQIRNGVEAEPRAQRLACPCIWPEACSPV